MTVEIFQLVNIFDSNNEAVQQFYFVHIYFVYIQNDFLLSLFGNAPKQERCSCIPSLIAEHCTENGSKGSSSIHKVL